MSDKYVEKTFLYLLVLSVLLHLAVYQLIALIPPAKTETEQAPTMVDLTDLPYLPEIPKSTPAPPEPKRQAKREPEMRQKAAKEPPLKQERETARVVPQPPRPQPPVLPPRPAPPAQPKQPAQPGQATESARADAQASRKAEAPPVTREKGESAPVTRGEGILKPKSGEMIAPSKLFPSAGKLARMEENYRRKYGREIEKGEASFLDTDDIRFGSFLRRFESAVYETWRYPEAALMRGIQGTTPVRITFNRSGEIVQVELLDTAGSRILDDEVMRTLKHLGPIGSFPKGFTGDVYKLIAFFQYGIGGGRLR